MAKATVFVKLNLIQYRAICFLRTPDYYTKMLAKQYWQASLANMLCTMPVDTKEQLVDVVCHGIITCDTISSISLLKWECPLFNREKPLCYNDGLLSMVKSHRRGTETSISHFCRELNCFKL